MRKDIKVQDDKDRHARDEHYCPDTKPVVTCIGRTFDLAGSRGIFGPVEGSCECPNEIAQREA